MSAPRVVTLVQGRMGSARLPGKSLRPLGTQKVPGKNLRSLAGRPMILHVLGRAAAMGFDTWFVTTTRDLDDELCRVVRDAGYPVFRGDERDVLHRMATAAKMACADVVVRVTGDCPCFAPDVGARVVEKFLELDDSFKPAIVTNDTLTSGWPDGLDVEVFPAGLLYRADDAIVRPGYPLQANEQDRLWQHREHVTPWMRQTVSHIVVGNDEDWRRVKLSVDTIDDFERVSEVFACGLDSDDLSWNALRTAYVAWRTKNGAAV